MLVRFAVQNFLSFHERQVFSMVAGKQSRMKSHLYQFNGKRILKGSIIYGANASGKSNLIKAVKFGRDIVFDGLRPSLLGKKHFRIDSKCIDEPGVFQYDFTTDEKSYSYGFAISYRNRKIIEEWLFQIENGKELCIFEREEGEKLRTDLEFSTDENRLRFDLYGMDVSDDHTFLEEITDHKLQDVEDFKGFFDTIKWFGSLLCIFPNSRSDISYYLEKDVLQTAGELLRYFDTGIESITGVDKPLDELLSFMPEPIRTDIVNDLIKQFSGKEKRLVNKIEFTTRGRRFIISEIDGEYRGTELMMSHGNENDLFGFDDESDGTRRLFDLIPIFQKGMEHSVILVDELDRSFHSKLTKEFIQRFFEQTESSPSQLIATMHDADVMDLELLRQDEIWFVERNEQHSSQLFSLNQFKERFDKDVSKEYLNGRYGALPVFGFYWPEEENEDE